MAAMLLQVMTLMTLITVSHQACSSADWVDLGEKCYQAIDSGKVPYSAAKTGCSDIGGLVATMKTPQEAINVFTMIIGNDFSWDEDSQIYVGITDEDAENTWVWSDGTTWDATVHPNLFKTGHGPGSTGTYSYIQRWQVKTAGGTPKLLVGYICEQAQTEPTLATSCPDATWWQIGSSCYLPIMEAVPWYTARVECQKKGEGADLAIAKDPLVTNLAQAMFGNLDLTALGGRFWIGLTDQVVEGTWTWVDGTELDTGDDRFAAGEGTQGGVDTMMNFASVMDTWNSEGFRGQGLKGYICEMPLDPSVVVSSAAELSYYLLNTDTENAEFLPDLTGTGIEACFEKCTSASTDECAAITWNREFNQCFRPVPAEYPGATLRPEKYCCVHLVKETGSTCAETEQILPGHMAVGLTLLSTSALADSAACYDACRGDTTCGSASFCSGSCMQYAPMTTAQLEAQSTLISPKDPNVTCDSLRNVACESSAATTCETGWTLVGSSCLQILSTTGNRHEAMYACQDQLPGSQAASIDDPADIASYAAVWTDAGLSATDQVWIGAFGSPGDTTWYWLDGTAVGTHAYQSGEGPGSSITDTTYTLTDTTTYYTSTGECVSPCAGVMCEKPL